MNDLSIHCKCFLYRSIVLHVFSLVQWPLGKGLGSVYRMGISNILFVVQPGVLG